jgi:predicted phage tail protein
MTNPGFQAQQMAQQAQQQQAQASMRAAQDAQRLGQLHQNHSPHQRQHYAPRRRGGFLSGLVTLVLLVIFLSIAIVVFRQVAPELFGDALSWLNQLG